MTNARTLSFSGYSWAVKSSAGAVSPGPNMFSDGPENVWVDGAGRLHLRIRQSKQGWLCAEVTLAQSLGYGTYRFSVASPVGGLDPSVVLGLFTWSDDAAYNHREVDIEFARWGEPLDPMSAQYVVQPAECLGHRTRFTQAASLAPSVHSFIWVPGHVTFASVSGSGQPIASSTYTGTDVPQHGGEHAHINLWLYTGMAPTNGAEAEVVLSDFSFTPL